MSYKEKPTQQQPRSCLTADYTDHVRYKLHEEKQNLFHLNSITVF